MKTRRVLVVALVLVALATILPESRAALPVSGSTMNVQVRVYRQPSRGDYRFLSNVPVQLSNGMTGKTSGAAGMKGTFFVRNLPRANYSARAFVGGRWYPTTGYQWLGTTLRVNIQIP